MLCDPPSVQILANSIRELQNRRNRDARGQLWIEGIRNFVRASDAGMCFDQVVYSRILLKSDLAEKLARRMRRSGVERVSLTPEQFRAISRAPRPSGIGAIVRQPWFDLAELSCEATRFFLAIEQLRDTGNLGTILRTAEAAGAAGVIFVGECCDPFDPTVVRASMGGVLGVPLVRATFAQFTTWIRTSPVMLAGLSPRGEAMWTDIPCDRAVVLALGEERSGLSPEMRRLCTSTFRLPIFGRADSLNVAVAAGVAMYELVRRRQ